MINKQDLKNLIGNMDTIIEIGAANGDDTAELLKFGKVIAFEPEPMNVEILKTRFDGDWNFTLVEAAVGDTMGRTTFNRSRTNDPAALRLSGSILPPKNHVKHWDWIYFDQPMEVRTVTLDSVIDSPLVDFIWCDAQGAEGLIIKGGQETLKKTRYILMEYANDEHYEGQPTLFELCKMLPDFEPVIDYGTDVLFKNKNL
jgi:FkbM family methyltransferase